MLVMLKFMRRFLLLFQIVLQRYNDFILYDTEFRLYVSSVIERIKCRRVSNPSSKKLTSGDSDLGQVTQALTSSLISKPNQPPIYTNGAAAGVQVTCFGEVVHDSTTLHFQIIRLAKQIYAWIGCNCAKLGHLYAAAPTRTSTVSVTSIVGGSSDNTGSGIARRLVSRTGLNIILACNIPKNNPMVELDAEKLLVQKLIGLGYIKPKSQGL